MKSTREFSVLLVCFGDYPEYSLRAIEQILNVSDPKQRCFDFHVGANACCSETVEELRRLADEGLIDTLIQSNLNLDKDPMMRLLIDRTETDYFFWLDDDTIVEQGWDAEMANFIRENHPFDAAGLVYVGHRNHHYWKYLRMRPWYVGEDRFTGQSQNVTVFPLGAAFIANTFFVRLHNYPDKAMLKKNDDRLFGDLLAQQNGRLLHFSKELQDRLFPDFTAERRGTGEGLSAFRYDIDPVTGFEEVGGGESREEDEDSVSDDVLGFMGLNNLGNEQVAQGKWDEALETYRRALKIAPDRPELHYNIANTLNHFKRYDEALISYRRALELDPNYSMAHNNTGILLNKLGRCDEAVEHYKQALSSDPKSEAVHNNLGNVYRNLGRFEEAVASYRNALAIDSSVAQCHNHLAKALIHLGALDEALVHFRLALYQRPDYREARMSRAEFLLGLGEYEVGWEEYQSRFDFYTGLRRPYSQPEWDGSDVEGKSVFVYPEKRLGHVIQFLRYLPLLRERGARVWLECPEVWWRLFESIPEIELIAPGNLPPQFDVHTSINNLPYLFKTTIQTVPSQVPYICLPENGEYGLPVNGSPGLIRVGMVWKGGVEGGSEWEKWHCCSLAHFRPLLDVPGISLTSLQRGMSEEEYRELGELSQIEDFGPRLSDLAELAHALDHLDLLITVDGPPAHLAAGMGKPVWLLANASPSWEWMLEGEQTPWYPSVKIFRQPSPGDWDSVIARIGKELETLIDDHLAVI